MESCCIAKGAQPGGMEWGRGGKEAQKVRDVTFMAHLWLILIVVWLKPTQHCKAIIIQLKKDGSESGSFLSNSLWLHGLYSPWNSPGTSTSSSRFRASFWFEAGGMRLSLLQGIFPTQRSNPSLPHCRQIFYQLSHRQYQKDSVQAVPRWAHEPSSCPCKG